MPVVKLSSKNQIVIPKEAREALGLKPGSGVLVSVIGNRVRLYKEPKSWEKAIRGLGKGLYGPDYLKKERESWD